MKSLENRIFDYLSANLSPKRFEHSYQVAKLASELAGISGSDILKAQTAGLLHDCAKSKNDKQLIDFFKGREVKIPYFTEIKQYSPQLLHSYAGAIIASEKFQITDRSILNAISSHTLGRENMGLTEKIIFVSDAVSYDRQHAFAVKIRKLAFKDLDKAFISVLSEKIKYVIDKGDWLCPQTLAAWNYYAKKN